MAAPNTPMSEDFGRFVETGSTDPAAQADPTLAQPDEADQLRAQLAQRDETIQQLAGRPPAAPVPATAAPVAIPAMGPMPDQTTQPVEFEQWILESQRRSELRQGQVVEQTARAAIGEARALAITQEFIARNPEYVGVPQEQVRTALSGAMGELGLSELPNDATALIAKAVGNLGAQEASLSEARRIREAGHVVVPDPTKAADRSGGMAGGTTAAAGSGKKADDEEKVVTMIDAIRNIQAKSGFF